jgi:hypothetical protein
MNRRVWNPSRNVINQSINQSKIRWALGPSQPFKSAGTGEIALEFLQQGVQHLVLYLHCKFNAYLAYGYTSMAWRQVRVTFIPKPKNLIILRLRLLILQTVIFPFEDNGEVSG